MRVIAAYMLAVLGGDNDPDAAKIKSILDAVGTSAPEDEVKKVIGELSGKDLDALIEQGSEKLAAVPGGGGGAAPAAAGGDAPAEEKKEEAAAAAEESEDESEEEMDFDLFD